MSTPRFRSFHAGSQIRLPVNRQLNVCSGRRLAVTARSEGSVSVRKSRGLAAVPDDRWQAIVRPKTGVRTAPTTGDLQHELHADDLDVRHQVIGSL